ncbi:MAG: hypothetical protein JJT78_09150 [Leptospira sp.]|nr:hypothetical protein [Leptospira sp.]
MAHTVYIRGIKDDLLAQITREDSSLLISEEKSSRRGAEFTEGKKEGLIDSLAVGSFLGKVLPFCKDKSVDCKTYLKNTSKFYLNKYVVDGLYHPKYKNLRMIVGWGIVLGLLYWLVYSQVTGGFGNVYRFASPLLLTSILFTFTSGLGYSQPAAGKVMHPGCF